MGIYGALPAHTARRDSEDRAVLVDTKLLIFERLLHLLKVTVSAANNPQLTRGIERDIIRFTGAAAYGPIGNGSHDEACDDDNEPLPRNRYVSPKEASGIADLFRKYFGQDLAMLERVMGIKLIHLELFKIVAHRRIELLGGDARADVERKRRLDFHPQVAAAANAEVDFFGEVSELFRDVRQLPFCNWQANGIRRSIAEFDARNGVITIRISHEYDEADPSRPDQLQVLDSAVDELDVILARYLRVLERYTIVLQVVTKEGENMTVVSFSWKPGTATDAGWLVMHDFRTRIRAGLPSLLDEDDPVKVQRIRFEDTEAMLKIRVLLGPPEAVSGAGVRDEWFNQAMTRCHEVRRETGLVKQLYLDPHNEYGASIIISAAF